MTSINAMAMTDFVREVRARCDGAIDPAEMGRVLAANRIEAASLDGFVRFAPGRYTRHLVHKDRDVEILRQVVKTRLNLEMAATQEMLKIALTDPAEEHAIIEDFRRERAVEYADLLERIPEFLAELDRERARGRTTYAEVEESEADLHRFQSWLAKIAARDYFDAPGAAPAVPARRSR